MFKTIALFIINFIEDNGTLLRLLKPIARKLLGAELSDFLFTYFEQIVRLVEFAENVYKTGVEKRDYVLIELKKDITIMRNMPKKFWFELIINLALGYLTAKGKANTGQGKKSETEN